MENLNFPWLAKEGPEGNTLFTDSKGNEIGETYELAVRDWILKASARYGVLTEIYESLGQHQDMCMGDECPTCDALNRLTEIKFRNKGCRGCAEGWVLKGETPKGERRGSFFRPPLGKSVRYHVDPEGRSYDCLKDAHELAEENARD